MFHYLFVYFSLEIDNWPQARSLCDACIGEHDNKVFHGSAAASTIVRVWNRQLKTWQKIKVTVGYYCQKAYVN